MFSRLVLCELIAMLKRWGLKISLRLRITILIVSILLPVIALHAYLSYQSFRIRYNQAVLNTNEVANLAGKLFEEFVAGVFRHEAVMGNMLAIPSSLDAEEINRWFANNMPALIGIRTFAWADPAGIVRASDMPGLIGRDISSRSYYREIRDGETWSVTDLYACEATGQTVFTLAEGIRNEGDGMLQGIMIAVIEKAQLESLLFLHRPAGVSMALFDGKDVPAYRSPNENEAGATAAFEDDGKWPVTVPLSFGWVIRASWDKEAISGPLYAAVLRRSVLFGMFLIAVFILPLLLSRDISRSVTKLRAFADSISRGNDVPDPQTFTVTEFQELAAAFKALAAEVRTREESLTRERNVLHGIMTCTDVMLAFLDRDFNFLVVNPAYAKASGKPPEALIGKNHFEIFPHQENEAIFRHVRETGQTVYYRDKPFEFQDQPERGITYWDWSLSPVTAKGESLGFIFALRETTRYKQAEDKLRLHARILESMDEGVSVTDRNALILYTNPAEDAMFGYAPGELIGRHVTLLNDYPAEKNSDYVASVIDQLLSVGSWKGEIRNKRKDGAVFYTYSRISRLDLDEGSCFVCVQRDVTAEKNISQKLLENQEALSSANRRLEQTVLERTRALENANQELDWRASKLRALAGDLTTVEQRVRRNVSKILHDHLQQILAAAKLQAQGLSSGGNAEALDDLDRLLIEAIEISRSLTVQLSPPILFDSGLSTGLSWLVRWMKEKHNFKVNLIIEKDFPHIAEDIKLFLFEATRELLFNSLKHADVHTATVVLRQSDDHQAQVIVRDPGKGFDIRGLKPSDQSYDGFGLFSIMERIPLFGGRIEADSAPGKGTQFTLTVPCAAMHEKTPASAPGADGSKPVPNRHERKIRILIADDHAAMRQGLGKMLGGEPDMEIVGEAENGIEALELAGKVRPDVILMDIEMPILDGVESTRMIHEAFPGIEVIGLSMSGEAESGRNIMAAGAAACIPKTGTRDRFLTQIRSSTSASGGDSQITAV